MSEQQWEYRAWRQRAKPKGPIPVRYTSHATPILAQAVEQRDIWHKRYPGWVVGVSRRPTPKPWQDFDPEADR